MVIILDLDGTLLSVNSFRLWTEFLARARFSHLGHLRRTKIALTALMAIAARKMRFTDHRRLKWRLQKLWQDSVAGDNGAAEQNFVRELMGFVRPEFAALLAEISAGKVDAILATAAAGEYAVGLGKSLGFAHVLATASHRAEDDPENLGGQKLFSVLRLITDRGWQERPRILFTDRRDDLPMIRICKTVFWFGSEAEGAELQAMVPYVKILQGFPTGSLTSQMIKPSTKFAVHRGGKMNAA